MGGVVGVAGCAPKAGVLTRATIGFVTVRYWSQAKDRKRRTRFLDLCAPHDIPLTVARKKAGILGSGLVDRQMVAGVRFELTTSGL